jgi:SAM-dependent methyltransferase
MGDVAALPYADNSFDAGVCTQVYEYVPDIDRALAELYRVLKPGGRGVIVDTDWESCVWHSSDPARMRRMIEAWDRHCPHPHLPGTLAPRLRAAGFESRADAIVLINDRYHPDTYSFGVIPLLAAYAKKHGFVPREEADAWVADLQELGQRGEYFFSLNRYFFSVSKPAG